MNDSKPIDVLDDMGGRFALRVHLQGDGDVIIAMRNLEGRPPDVGSVEVCASGSRSPGLAGRLRAAFAPKPGASPESFKAIYYENRDTFLVEAVDHSDAEMTRYELRVLHVFSNDPHHAIQYKAGDEFSCSVSKIVPGASSHVEWSLERIVRWRIEGNAPVMEVAPASEAFMAGAVARRAHIIRTGTSRGLPMSPDEIGSIALPQPPATEPVVEAIKGEGCPRTERGSTMSDDRTFPVVFTCEHGHLQRSHDGTAFVAAGNFTGLMTAIADTLVTLTRERDEALARAGERATACMYEGLAARREAEERWRKDVTDLRDRATAAEAERDRLREERDAERARAEEWKGASDRHLAEKQQIAAERDSARREISQQAEALAQMRQALAELHKILYPPKRTYAWNGHRHGIGFPHLSDHDFAGMVRMLTPSDLEHEPTVAAARDRIVHLSELVAAARGVLTSLGFAVPSPPTDDRAGDVIPVDEIQPEQIREQIAKRQQMLPQLIGWLYPRIVRSEIAKLEARLHPVPAPTSTPEKAP